MTGLTGTYWINNKKYCAECEREVARESKHCLPCIRYENRVRLSAELSNLYTNISLPYGIGI